MWPDPEWRGLASFAFGRAVEVFNARRAVTCATRSTTRRARSPAKGISVLPEHNTSASEGNPSETERGTSASEISPKPPEQGAPVAGGNGPNPPWWFKLILALAVLTTGVLLVIVGHVNPVEVVAILAALGMLYATLLA